MLRRVPPVVLAAIATAVVAAVVVAVVVLTGGASGRQVPACTPEQDAGPYGCIVLVSIDGSVGGRAAAEPQGGTITVRILRDEGRDHLVWTGDCNGGEGDVAVTATRWRLGDVLTGQRACEGGAPIDVWAARLFSSGSTLRVDDRDDGTLELARGDVRARFDQVIAPGP